MKLPVLVVGGSGVIGGALTSHLERKEAVVSTARFLPNASERFIQLDLAADSWPALPKCRAAVICAAVTRQDECRRNPDRTRHINVVQTLKLIHQLIAADTFVVFLSTNLVFDGTKPMTDPAEPLAPKTEYGRQKAEVERALAQWRGHVAIVRLTKVFYPRMPLLRKWVANFSAGQPVNAFSDYVCSPISLPTVARGIARIALESRSGLWQFSGPVDLSYAEIAKHLARMCGAEPSLVKAVTPQEETMEDLPAHTTLNALRACRELQLDFLPPTELLAECLGPSTNSCEGAN